MLSLRPEQLQPLERAVREEYVRRLVAHLRVLFEEDLTGVGDEELRELVFRAVGNAESYGVVYESDVARFAEYAVFLGEDFDTASLTPWAGEILRDSTIDGKEKMNRIDTMIREIYQSR